MENARFFALVAVSVALGVTLVPPGRGVGAPWRPALEVRSPASDAANTTILIDPGSWWMETGSNVSLDATWVNAPPGCALEPTWFRWAIAPGGSDGTLGATNRSTTVFTADDQSSGTTTVAVQAASTLRCNGTFRGLWARAESVMTVAAPVAVTGLSAEPNPISPGSIVGLTGTVDGGSPPYRLRVAWGDGATSWANVSGPGTFSVGHAYADNGTYVPTVVTSDAAGSLAQGRPTEPITVSEAFAAAIEPSVVVAEVGVPVTFHVRTLDAPANFSSVFACDNAEPAGNTSAPGLSYGCSFNSAGTSWVTFEAVGSWSPYAVATAELDETVEPPPSLLLGPDPASGEVGATVYARLVLAGGVPPFTVRWTLVGTGGSGRETIPSDGSAYVPLVSGTAGTFVLDTVVVDALGQQSTGATEPVVFLPPLGLAAAAVAGIGTDDVRLNVSSTVFGGAPPYDWTIVPSLAAENGSATSGTLPSAGAISWNATYRTEAVLRVTVEVVDSDGGSRSTNLTVATVAALTVTADAVPAGPGRVELSMSISGGLGPYAYRWTDSSGDQWNGTATGPGSLLLREGTDADGNLEFSVTITDALGFETTAGANATIAGAAAAPPGSLDAAPLIVVAALCGVGGLGAWEARRRTHRRPPRPAALPDPIAVLREVIEPSDGVDRGLVEMLAEERGLTPEIVRETLRRLQESGTVRAARGFDGEEVLAWSEPGSP